MDFIAEKQFFAWAQDRGIVPDLRHAAPESLIYSVRAVQICAWRLPARADDLPLFLSHLLAGLDTWSECYLWPRGGMWPDVERIADWSLQIRNLILQRLGFLGAFRGAVRCSLDDSEKLMAIIFAQLTSGRTERDELFVVPDHGQQMLCLEHHKRAYATSRDERRLLELVEYMTRGGYSLATDALDEERIDLLGD